MTLVLTITAFGCGNKGESGSAEAADAVKVVEFDLTNEEYAFWCGQRSAGTFRAS